MKRFEKPILVTRPYLPDLEEFTRGCEEIWANQWLTNNGPMLQKFHSELAKYLQVPESNMALFNNGTLALEMGFKAMGLFGAEVITTPFTFVATSHALKRISAKPIFADIDPETMCLSPSAAEKLITPRTKAIVPVHVYGNVCDIEGFERLREKYGVKIIYDAAHAFGVTIGQSKRCKSKSGAEVEQWNANLHCSPSDFTSQQSIAAVGDMSMFSFHPTKLFHSCEGGCLVFKDARLQQKLYDLRNFAIHDELHCVDVGTNAKMNELQALMGRCCLRKIADLLAWRHEIAAEYAKAFTGSKVKWIGKSANDAYCPVLFESVEIREKVYVELQSKCNVFARRYFYPLLTDFPPYFYAKGTCPIAENVASRVLTLPTYYGLTLEEVKSIAENVMEIVS